MTDRIISLDAAIEAVNGEKVERADATDESYNLALDHAIEALSALPAVDEPRINGDVWDFLMGVGPLEGFYFGEKHPSRKGAFWWRKVMRERSAMFQEESAPPEIE